MQTKIFTVAEANAVLERVVKPAVHRLAELIAAVEAVRTEIEVSRLVVGTGASESNPDRADLVRLERRHRELEVEVREEVEAVQAAGGLIKDARSGLVDFFSILDGKLVFLCWKRGEDRIRYWHMVEEGYRGRRLLTIRAPREE